MSTTKLPLAAIFLAGILAADFASAGEGRSDSKNRARETTIKALAAELDGDLEARARLLAEAAQLDPQSAAQSQLGKVRAKGGWLTIDDAAEKLNDAKAMQRYETLREGMIDTAPAHWQLSQRCVAAKLPDQARAHMNRVLDLDPNFEPARAALGYKKINGVWVSPEQLTVDEAQVAAEAISVNKHGKLMKELLEDFTSNDARKQSKSKQRLLEIRDPSTILAAERILSPKNEMIAQVVVAYLANIKDPIATMSLARHSVFYPAAEVRREAAMKLGDRDLHDYAPPLLNMLSSPIQSSAQPVYGQRGQLMGMRQIFTREAQDQNQLLMVDSEIARRHVVVIGLPDLLALRQPRDQKAAIEMAIREKELEESELMARASVAANNQLRLKQAELQNKQIAQTNAVVMQVLSAATGVELPAYPDVWWQWYDDQVGLSSQGRKYTVSTRVYRQYESKAYETVLRHSCFVAGTMVATHRGQVAIEKIKVGDMVLSKNIATGALEFKPALQKTVREPSELTLLKAGGKSFECTRGHHFWVSGRGWVKAEDLRPGMVLHAAENPVKVEEACMGGEAETYNLRVADNANYFVGEGRILSHDVTARTPTREAIPGYVAAK